MKKIVLGILCLIVMAISCELPQSLTIKGGPTLYIPLGSPLDDENKIGNFFSPDEIKKMMGEDTNIIDYWIPGSEKEPLQAYIVHYPIVQMNLDLSEYMSGMAAVSDFSYTLPPEVSSPPVPIPPGGSLYLTKDGPKNNHADNAPLFTVDLSDMFKLVTEVKGGERAFGIEIDYTSEFESNLKVSIPAFGVGASGVYKQGEKDGNKLRFVNTGNHTFNPQDDLVNGELKIYLQVTGPCSGTIAPDIVFNWDTAIIKPDENLKDTFDIDFDLSDSLGEGVSFKEVKGYIYVGGVGSNATLSLTPASSGNLVTGSSTLINRTKPSFFSSTQPFNQTLPDDSLAQAYLDFTGIINTPGSTSIEYDLKIYERGIENGKEVDTMIYADLIIVLSMEFKVEGVSSMPGYVPLKLGFGDLFSDMGNGDDWFGRTDDGENSLLGNIDSVRIILKDLQNDIFYDDSFSILFINFDRDGKPYFPQMINFKDKPEPSMTMIMDEIPVPFSPKIELLLQVDPGITTATLKIKRQDFNRNPDPKFDFFLVVEADTNFNQTITF